jgi:hypothetical protein
MAISEQEKQRRRALIEGRRAREERHRQATPAAEALGPILPVLQTAGKVLEWPRHGVVEGVQRYGEAQEAEERRGGRLGKLDKYSHLGREVLSDVFDIGADVTPLGLIPGAERPGEWLDPSGETELGIALEAHKQLFREKMGRDPSIMDLYDMKAQVQDIAMPGIAARHKIGPLEFSNRALLELGAEVPAVAAEIYFTGGAATLGRKVATKGTQAAARVAASQTGKGATREALGKAGGLGIRGTAGVAGEGLKTFHYIDVAFTAIVGPVLRFGVTWGIIKPTKVALRTVGLPPKLTLGGARIILNHFRDTTVQKGASLKDINKVASDGIDAMSREGAVEPGMRVINDLYESTIDNPRPKPDLIDEAYKQQTPGKRVFDSFKSPVLRDPSPWRERTRDIVRSITGAVDSVHTQIRANMDPRYRRMRTADVPESERFQQKTGNRVSDSLEEAQDPWLNRKEAMIMKARNGFAYYTAALHRRGMIEWNVGGYSERALKELDDDAEAMLASGISAGGLIEDAPNNIKRMGNHKILMPQDTHAGQNLRGHVWIDVHEAGPLRGAPVTYLNREGRAAGPIIREARTNKAGRAILDDEGEEIMDWVALNLDPTLADVGEHIGLYRPQLRSVKNVIQRIDAEGKPIKDDWMDAYEVFEEMGAITDELEQALAMTGSPIAGSVIRSAGGHYFPRNPLMEKVVGGRLPRADPAPELVINMQETGRLLPTRHSKHRVYKSQAEAQWAGHWFLHPSMAAESHATYVAEMIMAHKSGVFASSVAERYGIPYSTVKRVLGDDTSKQMDGYITKIEQALEDILARQKRLGITVPRQMNAEARRLLKQVRKVQKIDDKFTPTEDGELHPKLVEHVKKMNTDLLAWEKQFKSVASGLKATTAQKKQLTKALNRAKAANDEYKRISDRDLKSISGVGIESLYFPVAFRKAILDSNIARTQIQNPGWLSKFNSMLRIFGATGDMSALGIQGWTGVLNDALVEMQVTKELDAISGLVIPRAGRRKPSMAAFSASWEAFRNSGNEIVGEYMWRMEEIAKQTGSLGPTELANQGLAILKNAPDLIMTPGMRSIPGIKRVDASFTHYGNVLRVEMATMEMDIARLTTGKTNAQLIADGTAAEIMRVGNFMSGVGRRGFLGNVGQFLLFAPRYMHARMRMLTLAAQGSLPYGSKAVQQQLAARYMSRMFGTAVYLTFVINETLGEETDINPFIRNKATGNFFYNPNFIRVHAGPIDISLLGPWDSMLRIMTLPLFIGANALQEGMKSFSDVKSIISAPATSLIVDLLTGQDALGRRMRPDIEEGASTWDTIVGVSGWLGDQMLEHLTPFAWGDVVHGRPGEPSVAERVVGGVRKAGDDPLAATGDVAVATGQTVLQFLGVKSAYESITETLNESRADIIENMSREQKLQAFGVVTGGMTEEEMDAIWARVGQSWWQGIIDVGDDFRVSVSFTGRLGDKVPTWDRLANDIQKNIDRMIANNTFAQHMTADEKAALADRITERRKASAGEYGQYKLEREAIDLTEIGLLQRIEAAYLGIQKNMKADGITYTSYEINKETGEVEERKEKKIIHPGDIEAYLKLVREVRKHFSTLKRSLTQPGIVNDVTKERSGEGKFYGVIDALFADQESRLGSEWDVDIYDAASQLYYDSLYEETDVGPSIVSPSTGIMDWDMRDKKLVEWRKQMAKDFPHLTEGRINRYLWRIEDSTVKDVPKLTESLLEMQKYISRAPMVAGKTFYELDEPAIQRVIRNSPGVDEDTIRREYKSYKAATSGIKKIINTKAQGMGIYSLADVDAQREAEIDAYFGMRGIPRGTIQYKVEQEKRGLLEGMIVLLGKRGTVDTNPPTTRRGYAVLAILHRHADGTKFIDDITAFSNAVYHGLSLQDYELQPGETIRPRTKSTPGSIIKK